MTPEELKYLTVGIRFAETTLDRVKNKEGRKELKALVDGARYALTLEKSGLVEALKYRLAAGHNEWCPPVTCSCGHDRLQPILSALMGGCDHLEHAESLQTQLAALEEAAQAVLDYEKKEETGGHPWAELSEVLSSLPETDKVLVDKATVEDAKKWKELHADPKTHILIPLEKLTEFNALQAQNTKA